jgi:beta-aspartyl-peptidase (threonine type)
VAGQINVMSKLALAIHGGAGTILRSQMTQELEAEYRSGLKDALERGWKVLTQGGSSLDAVQEAVCSLEDFPLFNAGRGSVFTHEGKNEMDAAIMDGVRLRAGAVGFVKNVKNPVKLARLVMDRTEHVFLGGKGADQFALEMGAEMADDAYFFTEHRYEQFLRAREEGVVRLDHTAHEPQLAADAELDLAIDKKQIHQNKPMGTVGAVACDVNGHLAAATSTGGMSNKKFGRIGDTPIIGAGTYADDVCAVSGTGYGEFFMLGVTAYDVAARMKYQGISLEQASSAAIERLGKIGGDGGLIAVDSAGNVALPFNCEGMYRGFKTVDGPLKIDIYRD